MAGAEPDVSLLWARVLYASGVLYELLNEYQRATELIGASMRVYEQLGDDSGQARCWLETGLIHSDTGKVDDALVHFERAALLANRAGEQRTEVMALGGMANAENRRGHDSAAAAHYERLVPMIRVLRDDWSLSLALQNYGTILARQGKPAQARRRYEEALTINRTIDHKIGIAMILCNLEEVSPSGGANLREALAIAREAGSAELTGSTLVGLADAIQLTDRVAAAGYLEEAVTLAHKSSMPAVYCEVLERVANLIAGAEPGRAARLLGVANQIRADHGIEWTGHRAEISVEATRGARKQLGDAGFRREFAAGESLSLEESEVEARAGLAFFARDDSRAAATPSANFADLTQRETQVLRLIATGASDRDIGEALFISPKTANHHVTRILSKLGCSSRAAAAAIAARNGVL